MRRLLSVPVLVIFFLTAMIVVVVNFNLHKPRLLILQSYNRDYSWTRDVDTGIRRILDSKRHYALRWFYMDTKRHPWPEYRKSIGQSARRLIDQWQPDVVVAVDDDAQEYVMKYYVDHPRIRIVFAGVNGEITPYGYDQASNVTGILERKELQAVKEALLSMTLPRRAGAKPGMRTESSHRDRAKAVRSGEVMSTAERSPLSCAGAGDSCWLKLFPRWQATAQPGIAELSRNEDALVRAFDWSPVRLAKLPQANISFRWQVAGQETLSRSEPSVPSVPNAPSGPAPSRVNPASASVEVRVIHLGDISESVRSDEVFIRAFDWSPIRLVESRLVQTFPEWQAAVEGAASRADFILTTNYRKLARSATDRTLIPPAEVVHWTLAHSPVPVFGTNGFFVEDGGNFAIGTSPFEQGEVAARMAVGIIERGITPRAIPVVSTREFVVFMRGGKMQEVGIYLPRLYESFARATNNYFD
ncbi:ABC-type uncharacterized transport system, periplasmic component [Gammaproteobacteria bacterium]